MDKELFELCKEVYEKTGWEDFKLNNWYIDPKKNYQIVPFTEDTEAPLYTSDYLLEKLPKYIENNGSDFLMAWLSMDNLGEDGWQFGYRVGAAKPLIKATADTPLKALLRLVIALHKAGQLQPARGDMQ